MTNTLVSVEWLKKNLNADNLIVLDASSELNTTGIIPSSRYFNLAENFTNKAGQFPNTIPSERQFEEECRKLGINKASQIVVYDNQGIYTSPRVWWMFRAMGHPNVFVLDGGLPEWIKNGYETVQKEVENYPTGDFKAVFDSSQMKLYEDILNNVSNKEALVIDARSSGRFNGTEKEPRKGLKSGHIPNSINIPYQSVLENGKYKSKEELKKVFEKEVLGNQELIFSCGSGITACIILLASELVLENDKSVYDGSWTEWAELQNLKES